MKTELTVIIPIYNEVETCEQIIDQVKAVLIPKQIIVVNDGSNDGTRELLESITEIQLINHEVNQGKGAAVRSAIPLIDGKYVVLQDADLEYDPDDFPQMIQPLKDSEADVVFGDRRLRQMNPFTFHTIGNRMITWFSNLINRNRIIDMAACYKMMSVEYLKSLDLKSKGFGLEAEITAKVFRKGYRVIEIPISYNRRTKKEGKKLRLKDGLVAAWACLRYKFFD